MRLTDDKKASIGKYAQLYDEKSRRLLVLLLQKAIVATAFYNQIFCILLGLNRCKSLDLQEVIKQSVGQQLLIADEIKQLEEDSQGVLDMETFDDLYGLCSFFDLWFEEDVVNKLYKLLKI